MTVLHQVIGNRILSSVLVPFDFDLAASTFTAGMDKRLAPGPFYTAPIVQGDWDGTGVGDYVLFPRGDLLANQTELFYANLDINQGSIAFWYTPEYDGNDGITHYIIDGGANSSLRIYKHSNDFLTIYVGGQANSVSAAAWTAGTTYFVVVRWDSKNTIDGTNYTCVSVNNVHAFAVTTQPSPTAVSANIAIGCAIGGVLSSDAIIEGLTVSRRVWTDGDGYGTDIGVDDEIEDIYNAGAGQDPTLVTTAFDVVLCVPTNSTDEALTTGTGEAWSMPHASNVPDVPFMSDGGLPGTPYAIEYDGASTETQVSDNATIQDLHDAEMTAGIWVRRDGTSAHEVLIQKGDFVTGWAMRWLSDSRIQVVIQAATTDAQSYVRLGTDVPLSAVDGKFHYVVFNFDDAGDRKIYISIDGKWATSYEVQTAAVGAVVSDVGDDLSIGAFSNATGVLEGAIAWVALWSDDHHTAGTDFIPPRTAPTPGGNLVESWHLDEGTGATAAAQVTTPANDGTISNGSWSSIWQIEGTPVVPQSHTFDGSATVVDCGSDASLDDIPSGGEITVGTWVRLDDDSADVTIVGKTTGFTTNGWHFRYDSSGYIIAYIVLADGLVTPFNVLLPSADQVWHYVGFHYEDTTRVGTVFVDGIWGDTSTTTGAYQSDAAADLIIGRRESATGYWDGAIGEVSIWNDDHFGAGVDFVPPARLDPPAAGGTLVESWPFTDGAGTTLSATVAGANDGTITPGTGIWLNTPDMALDEPGARTGSGGYNVGSDAADDGITIIETVTAETDYVIRLTGSYGQSGRAWPEIYLYDNTGAAQIGATYSLPRVHDLHTGANNSATLINANGAFTQQLVGWTAYNITDGSSTTITAVSGDKTTITGVLAGGTDNDWDTNDVYLLRPPNGNPYCRHPFATESIFVFRTPAACVSADIKIRNAAGEGVMQLHQCEVYESLIDNGDHEAMAGNPAILTGWTNSNLDAGDTEAEAVVIHAGAQSMEWNVGAQNENQYHPAISSGDKFVACGIWLYGDTAVQVQLRSSSANSAVMQYNPTLRNMPTGVAAAWTHYGGVFRIVAGGGGLIQIFAANAVPSGDRWTDDVYAIETDDVSLTVTPASQANSLEGTGIRVDGRDTLTQPIPAWYLTPTRGWIRWGYTPRHDAADQVAFGTTNTEAYLAVFWFDATHYAAVYWSAANTVTMEFNDGGGVHTTTWNATGAIVAGTLYQLELRYSSGWMRLYADGVQVAEIATAILFANIPTTGYWLADETGVDQADAVISPPA